MEVNNLTIIWHDNTEPVYSVHFQPNSGGASSERLVTGGGDNNVRVWKLKKNEEEVKVEYLSTLARHTQAINVVRFDPKGQILATAGDDGTVMIWTLSENIVKEFGQEDDEDLKESWTLKHTCRSSTSEIYDISWSPDSKFIITGSTDNVSRIYDASTGQQVNQITEHNHYVQGVAWDPLGEYVATQSADRAIHIYSLDPNSMGTAPKTYYKISRAELPTRIWDDSTNNTTEQAKQEQKSNPVESETPISSSVSTTTSATTVDPPRSPSPSQPVKAETYTSLNFSAMKSSMLYHTENLESFFRRLTFSPDGNFLFTTAGIFKNNTTNESEELTNTVYIYSRTGLNKPPIAHLPGYKKAALVVSFSPIFYKLDPSDDSKSSVFKVPYKMVYAVATQDSVFIYDTQHEFALGSVSSIHYRILTDISWNSDGDSLMVSAADGFCTLISFKEGELGKKLTVDYKTLIPKSKPEVNMESPTLNKRASAEMLPFSVKKTKIDFKSTSMPVVTNPFKAPIIQQQDGTRSCQADHETIDVDEESQCKDNAASAQMDHDTRDVDKDSSKPHEEQESGEEMMIDIDESNNKASNATDEVEVLDRANFEDNITHHSPIKKKKRVSPVLVSTIPPIMQSATTDQSKAN